MTLTGIIAELPKSNCSKFMKGTVTEKDGRYWFEADLLKGRKVECYLIENEKGELHEHKI